MDSMRKQIEKLVDKAAGAERSEDAMRFSQAALNAAHAAQVLATVEADHK